MDRKRQFEKTVTAIGIGTLLSGASYGLYCYLKTKNAPHTYENHSESSCKKPTSSGHLSKEMCSICHDSLKNYCEISPCQHPFHKKCIIQWQAYNKTCPICRSPFNV
ncbi:hypothetical protein MTP99_018090 [Tenebrio molitor]|nr:hypothetical protein MTP99_018090 [Tenebrio molitor]